MNSPVVILCLLVLSLSIGQGLAESVVIPNRYRLRARAEYKDSFCTPPENGVRTGAICKRTAKLLDGEIGPAEHSGVTTDYAYTYGGSVVGTEPWLAFEFSSIVRITGVTLHFYCNGTSPQLQLRIGRTDSVLMTPSCGVLRRQKMLFRFDGVSMDQEVIVLGLRRGGIFYLSEVQFFEGEITAPDPVISTSTPAILQSPDPMTSTSTAAILQPTSVRPLPVQSSPSSQVLPFQTSILTQSYVFQITSTAQPSSFVPRETVVPGGSSAVIPAAVAGVIVGLLLCTVFIAICILAAIFFIKKRKNIASKNGKNIEGFYTVQYKDSPSEPISKISIPYDFVKHSTKVSTIALPLLQEEEEEEIAEVTDSVVPAADVTNAELSDSSYLPVTSVRLAELLDVMYTPPTEQGERVTHFHEEKNVPVHNVLPPIPRNDHTANTNDVVEAIPLVSHVTEAQTGMEYGPSIEPEQEARSAVTVAEPESSFVAKIGKVNEVHSSITMDEDKRIPRGTGEEAISSELIQSDDVHATADVQEETTDLVRSYKDWRGSKRKKIVPPPLPPQISPSPPPPPPPPPPPQNIGPPTPKVKKGKKKKKKSKKMQEREPDLPQTPTSAQHLEKEIEILDLEDEPKAIQVRNTSTSDKSGGKSGSKTKEKKVKKTNKAKASKADSMTRQMSTDPSAGALQSEESREKLAKVDSCDTEEAANLKSAEEPQVSFAAYKEWRGSKKKKIVPPPPPPDRSSPPPPLPPPPPPPPPPLPTASTTGRERKAKFKKSTTIGNTKVTLFQQIDKTGNNDITLPTDSAITMKNSEPRTEPRVETVKEAKKADEATTGVDQTPQTITETNNTLESANKALTNPPPFSPSFKQWRGSKKKKFVPPPPPPPPPLPSTLAPPSGPSKPPISPKPVHVLQKKPSLSKSNKLPGQIPAKPVNPSESPIITASQKQLSLPRPKVPPKPPLLHQKSLPLKFQLPPKPAHQILHSQPVTTQLAPPPRPPSPTLYEE